MFDGLAQPKSIPSCLAYLGYDQSMDPLSVTASVIGLLTAASKAYELLGLIASVRNAPSTIVEARDEVKHVELALRALHRYLRRLDLARPRRKALIQVDDLIVTLADAMMGFSDFAKLLELLSGLTKLQVVISWPRYTTQMETHMSKMQRHKASLSVMLNIIQWYTNQFALRHSSSLLTDRVASESDLEAAQSQEKLHELIENVLQENTVLKQRLARLEDSFDAISALTQTALHGDPSCSFTGTWKQAVETDDASTIRGVDRGTGMSGSVVISRVEQLRFAFEDVLEQSWVYQRNQENECDCSFASSDQRSHAWSIFSGFSLGVISTLSVIAMPLSLADIYNRRYYERRDEEWEDSRTSEGLRGRDLGEGWTTSKVIATGVIYTRESVLKVEIY
ncbi:hypothetical protein B0T19DRAFT_83146 [Cercophora scortea]|uniref:Fungal N-terminal domain-containing protein n=1 Tax=Cercophora scortea TaxID=314031 RepID=A0AAE0IUS8_9PEZI|nr:hypothetical protein B0T19DRAFT_83146 [Cercophora scortea]